MKVTLQTVSELRHYFGESEIVVDFPLETVGGLLKCLKESYAFDMASQKHTMIFVNGKGCVDFGRRLAEGDHVAIVPILAAG